MRSIVGIFVLFSSLIVLAAPAENVELQTQESATAPALKKKKSLKSTQVSFDDVLVQGKYQFADEAVTTIEQDKVLDALLGVRTNFQDRVQKSADQY